MNVTNNINDQLQLTPLNQLGQGLNQARLTPLADQPAKQTSAGDPTGIEALIPRDERQISFNPVAMQKAHTLDEERVAKLLGLI